MSYANIWRRNLGFIRLAVITNLEYRINFLADAVAQPLFSSMIELVLWFAVFRSIGGGELAGFSREYYLAYALWAAFVARITSNWMYEFKMIEDVESGAINGLLVRPTSFFEYYLSQFMGYKILTAVISLIFPLAVAAYFHLPTIYSRIPGMLLLVTYFLLLVHCLSFCITTLAFKFNKVWSFTVAKNLGLWLVSGELVPLDLFPEAWRSFMVAQPFASAVYVPVGYVTGRIGHTALLTGFASTTVGILFFGTLGALLWRRGLRIYSGTGA
ncbi:MAG TPA: ABC-2 family transporter protein [Bdellovibrionota bacterium]|jgi:ABC-2 type transport system permease protein